MPTTFGEQWRRAEEARRGANASALVAACLLIGFLGWLEGVPIGHAAALGVLVWIPGTMLWAGFVERARLRRRGGA